MNAQRNVFVILTGAYGNIGDAMIRRRVLQWVRDDARIHAYIGSAPDAWAEQMDFTDSDEIYRSDRQWTWMLRAIFGRGPRALVFDPGEVNLKSSCIVIEVQTALLTLAVSMRRGRIIRPPRGLAPESPFLKRLHRMAAGLSTVSFWRDQQSAESMGLGESVPDTAFQEFLEDTPPVSQRKIVVVSMRAARPMISGETIEVLKNITQGRGWSIVCTSQVKVDEPRTRDLAERLGATFLAWGESSDAEQERRLRALYLKTAMVVTDRLHIAILGAALGAVPAELVPNPNGKIDRHFNQVGLDGISLDARSSSIEEQREFLETLLERRLEIVNALRTAKADVDRVERQVRTSLTKG